VTEFADAGADAFFMKRALALARRGGRTAPNPQVGAVVVRDGRIVGQGWHRGVGAPHAETVALAGAGDAARGATLYVTLEPCSFTTYPDGAPRVPCSHRCIRAGVARVVGAMTDPDVRVAGDGYRQLGAADVSVTVGVCEELARRLLAPYVKQRTTGLPYLVHKTAMTLDGKIAASDGSSKWITGPQARGWAHRVLRARADVIVVGIGTVLADDPELTERKRGGGAANGNERPLARVILDRSLRTPPTARIARPGTVIVAAEGHADGARRTALEATGAEVVTLPISPDAKEGGVDMQELARFFVNRNWYAALLEGGGETAGRFWEAGLVDKAFYFLAPKIVGGRNALTPVEGTGVAPGMAGATHLDVTRVRRLGPDILIEADVMALG